MTADHILVILKRHVEELYDLDPDTAAQLFQTTVMVARASGRVFEPPGLNIWQSNGTSELQEVPMSTSISFSDFRMTASCEFMQDVLPTRSVKSWADLRREFAP